MIPPKKEYEKVVEDEWVNGSIADIKYEMEHEFPAYESQEAWLGPAVKIILNLEGCEELKPSFWMYFKYGAKTKLFSTYIVHLVPNAVPGMDFDIDKLKDMKIRAMFTTKPGKGYQTMSMIRLLSGDVKKTENNEEVPF